VSKRRFFPHVEFTSVWYPHCFLGVFLASLYGPVDPLLLSILLVGVFCIAQLQHCMHVTSGSSSTLFAKFRYTDEDLRILNYLSALFVVICLALMGWLVLLGRPWFPLFLVAGMIFMLLYASPRKHEAMWGMGHFFLMAGSMYVIAGFVTIPACLIFAGIACLGNIVIKTYRLCTGDYDRVKPGFERGLGPVVTYYISGLILIGIGVVML